MVTRRSFLTATLAGVAGGCATLATTQLRPVDGRLRIVLADHPRLNRPGGFLKVQAVGSSNVLYVLAQQDGSYVTVSPICKHRGCTVDYAGERLECPCHGSQYSRNGAVLRGPTEAPLDRYETVLSPDGVLTIALEAASA